jgi:hypothetical protein
MDTRKDILVELPRPRRRTISVFALLLAVLISILTVPSASAAADPVSEVTATAGAVVEPVSTPSPTAATPPPTPAPAPAPAPVPPPTSAAETATTVVDRSLGSSPGSTVAQVVHESTQRGAEAVDAVVKSTGASHVPIVKDTTRRAGDAASSLVGTAAGEAETDGAPQHSSPGPGATERTTVERPVGPASRRGRVELPPSPSPRAANDLALSAPSEEVRLAVPGNASTIRLTAVDVRRAAGVTAPLLGNDAGPTRTGLSRNAPSPPPPPVGAAASLGGGGFGPSLLLFFALLSLFALAAPRAPTRLLPATVRYRPTPFICALERPG